MTALRLIAELYFWISNVESEKEFTKMYWIVRFSGLPTAGSCGEHTGTYLLRPLK